MDEESDKKSFIKLDSPQNYTARLVHSFAWQKFVK